MHVLAHACMNMHMHACALHAHASTCVQLVHVHAHACMSPPLFEMLLLVLPLLLVQVASGPIVPVAALVFQFRATLPPSHVGIGGCHQCLVEKLPTWDPF